MSNDIFSAWYHLREAAEYMMRVDTLDREGSASRFYTEQAEKHLAKATDALGFDLVKREAVKVEEAA